jgi:hypothetical protein
MESKLIESVVSGVFSLVTGLSAVWLKDFLERRRQTLHTHDRKESVLHKSRIRDPQHLNKLNTPKNYDPFFSVEKSEEFLENQSAIKGLDYIPASQLQTYPTFGIILLVPCVSFFMGAFAVNSGGHTLGSIFACFLGILSMLLIKARPTESMIRQLFIYELKVFAIWGSFLAGWILLRPVGFAPVYDDTLAIITFWACCVFIGGCVNYFLIGKRRQRIISASKNVGG